MSIFKKTLIAAMTGCIALLLVGPGVAMADRPLPAPPWDDDPSHWTKVNVYNCWSDPDLPEMYNPDENGDPQGEPCVDDVEIDNLLLVGSPAPGPIIECGIELTVEVWAKGETRIVALDTFDNDGHNSEDCDEVGINDLPWDNQICERIADDSGPLTDHEYWDAVEIDFTYSANIAGIIYAELLDGAGNRANGSNPLSVGSVFVDSDVYFPNITPPPTFNLSDTLISPFANDPAFEIVSKDNEPCEADEDGLEGWEFPT